MKLRTTIRVLVIVVAASKLGAQQTWNDPRTRALVERATERRTNQLADTALVDYKATAHGYVTFLAQFGEGFPEPPKIVKADELGLEVYWRAPDLRKQRIMGRRRHPAPSHRHQLPSRPPRHRPDTTSETSSVSAREMRFRMFRIRSLRSDFRSTTTRFTILFRFVSVRECSMSMK